MDAGAVTSHGAKDAASGAVFAGAGEFDAADRTRAERALLEICAAPFWARTLVAGRPYGSLDALLAAADAALEALPEPDVAAAVAAHPRIGERAHGRSAREQAGLAGADAALGAALAEGNRVYEERFGQRYLVCAAGRSGPELLAVLQDRLGNDPESERRVMRTELAKINRLRLAGLLGAAR